MKTYRIATSRLLLVLLLCCLLGTQVSKAMESGININMDFTRALIHLPDQGYKKGDSGDDIYDIKLKMQELGYYRKDASLSDDFNDTMVERIKQFQQRNDLKETGVINATTLSKLYADDAKTGSFYGQTSTSSSESSSQSNSGSSSSKSGGHWEWQWQWVWRYLTCFNTSRDCPKCRGLGSYQDLVQEKMPVWVPD